MIKRGFDILLASVGLIVLSPIIVLAAVMVKLDSVGPVFFTQERIGRGFRPFNIYKFRTMRQKGTVERSLVTVKGDRRITRVGRILRKTKIDELPQLVNVLFGEMSFVGPRPEVRQYVELFKEDYEEIARIRPGITDRASLKYRDEEGVLAGSENPQEVYVREILPDKIHLAKNYIRHHTLWSDMGILCQTLLKVINLKPAKSIKRM